jgi:hypothetical protein
MSGRVSAQEFGDDVSEGVMLDGGGGERDIDPNMSCDLDELERQASTWTCWRVCRPVLRKHECERF